MPKYVVVNGRVVVDPTYTGSEPQVPQTFACPEKALTCVYQMSDADAVGSATQLPLPSSTVNVVQKVQDVQYTNAFGVPGGIDGGQLLENISQNFFNSQTPFGLSEKLIALQGYSLHFKCDDSSSMRTICANGKSRWQNEEDRLHRYIDRLQYVPTGPITIDFLDRRDVITIYRNGKTPEQFTAEAHAKIRTAFSSPPVGGTPIYRNICGMLDNARGKTAHFLLTDGCPSDGAEEIENIKNRILNRYDPLNNPFTFLCCSDNPADTLWMHEIEEIACRPGSIGYVAAQQNFLAERTEVLNDQGPEFPYSEAVWDICNLVAAMNPNDLDALDQHAPLTKLTMDNLMGRTLTEIEYRSYFNQHPNAMWLFAEDYPLFLSTPIASQIPAVLLFDTTLANQLSYDISQRDDWSEPRAISRAEEMVLNQFQR